MSFNSERQVLLEEKVEVKTFNVVTGNILSISNKDNIGNGLLYLTTHRLLFLVHSASLSSMFGKNKRPMLYIAQSLSQILRISALDDKTLTVDFPDSFLNFNFNDKTAKQWNEKILEIIQK